MRSPELRSPATPLSSPGISVESGSTPGLLSRRISCSAMPRLSTPASPAFRGNWQATGRSYSPRWQTAEANAVRIPFVFLCPRLHRLSHPSPSEKGSFRTTTAPTGFVQITPITIRALHVFMSMSKSALDWSIGFESHRTS